MSGGKTKRYVVWVLPSASSDHVDEEISDAVEVPDGVNPEDHPGLQDELQEMVANHFQCGFREAKDDE